LAFWRNLRWRRPPSWKQEKCCNFWTVQPIFTIFDENKASETYYSKNLCHLAFWRNPRWRRPPSWKQEKCCNFWTVQPIFTIFDEDEASVTYYSTKLYHVTFWRNPRWRSPPSWIQKNAVTFEPFNRFSPYIILSYLCNTSTFVTLIKQQILM
jgi:hypothetical protein